MEKLVTRDQRKTFKFRVSGRSSDYISPSFGYGCLANCTYCYMKRNNPKGLSVATNTEDILSAINRHALMEVPFDNLEKPNQTDPEYVTYDIACNEDFVLHSKYYPWQKIFKFFVDHPVAKATLATKFIPPDEWLGFNPDGKVRIRFSLMPQRLSAVLEPNTSAILERIVQANVFIDAGYDVHFNFSPVVVYQGWLSDYEQLFKAVDENIEAKNKDRVKAEVIFLTHNEKKHLANLEAGLPGEDLIWTPDIQEEKDSQYGGRNVRYRYDLKSHYIKKFENLHGSIIPWNTIRYIF